jgi:hypothetical protein
MNVPISRSTVDVLDFAGYHTKFEKRKLVLNIILAQCRPHCVLCFAYSECLPAFILDSTDSSHNPKYLYQSYVVPVLKAGAIHDNRLISTPSDALTTALVIYFTYSGHGQWSCVLVYCPAHQACPTFPHFSQHYY